MLVLCASAGFDLQATCTYRILQKQFAGDNFVRGTGEVQEFHEVNTFAWDAYERGQDVHLQALPSQAALLLRQFKEKKEQLKKDVKAELLARYGGEEHLAAPKELLPEQSETYVEYSRHGKPIKGAEKVIVRSRYGLLRTSVHLCSHGS